MSGPAEFNISPIFGNTQTILTLSQSGDDIQLVLSRVTMPMPLPLPVRIPPNFFLNMVKGIYLGDITPLQFQIGNNWVFLNQVGFDSNNVATYRASGVPAISPITMQVLQPNARWGTFSPADIRFMNFNPRRISLPRGNPTGYRLNPINTMASNQFVYSITECNQTQSCLQCGNIGCPVNFTCNTMGSCVDGTTNLAMGLRIEPRPNDIFIMTTGIGIVADMGREVLDVRFLPTDEFTPTNVPPQPVRESWIYADNVSLAPPNDVFVVNQTYPLFVLSNGQKRYLTNPMTIGTGRDAFVRYTLVSGATAPSNAAAFRPRRTGNWRAPTFTPEDFQNFTFLPVTQDATASETRIALWQNSNRQGIMAVVQTQPNGNGGRGGNGGGGNGGSGNKQTPKPLWKEWWFWLIIIAIVILLIIGGFILFHSHHKTS